MTFNNAADCVNKNWLVCAEFDRGSFGSVKLCFPKESGKFAALRGKFQFCIKELINQNSKSLTKELKIIKLLYNTNPKFARRILTRIFDFSKTFLTADVKFIVMERLNPPSSIAVYRKVLTSIELLHCMGISHNDLKRGNIMETSDGIVKLIDFGLASHFGIFQSRRHIGTVKFMSINNHLGKIFPRNDYETMFYVVLDLFMKLPWSNSCRRINSILNMKRRFRHCILHDQDVSTFYSVFKQLPVLLDFGKHVYNTNVELNVNYLKCLLYNIENYSNLLKKRC